LRKSTNYSQYLAILLLLNVIMLHPKDIKQKKILFAALNWGYGHVMRSVVLLKKFEAQKNSLFVVCTEEQKELYLSENIKAEYIIDHGYPFEFSGKGHFSWDLFMSLRKLTVFKNKERILVKQLCTKFSIDLVLSDQRMGIFDTNTTSILITHQLNLPLGGWEKAAQLIYNNWLKNFDFIWVPDQKPPNNLAGKMSESNKGNTLYIGYLSRFDRNVNLPKNYKYGVLVTGPEPYARQFFEEQLHRLTKENALAFIIYNQTDARQEGKVQILKHQSTEAMASLLCSCELLITRSGYSTLMDIKALGIENVELHPTPGQAEQEYLARNVKL